MPVPYSDNLYSALDDDDDEDYPPQPAGPSTETGPNWNVSDAVTEDHDHHDEDVLSPSDGYFHASDAAAYDAPSSHARQSSNVPDVPNVLVEDPTLRDDERDTKTREAEHERRLSNMAALQSQAQHHSQSPAAGFGQSPPASSSRPHHSHRRSVEEDDNLDDIYESQQDVSRSPPRTQQLQSPARPTDNSPLFQQQPVDAPPAYTPSAPSGSQQDHTPSSPLSISSGGYQTFGSPPSTAGMGFPSEQARLLGPQREPESMGGEQPGDDQPRTLLQRMKRAFVGSDGRQKLTRILKRVLVLVVIVMVISSFSLYGEHPESKNPSKKPDGSPDTSHPVKPAPSTPPENGKPQEPEDPKDPEDPKEPQEPDSPVVTPPKDGQHQLMWKSRPYCREPARAFHLEVGFNAEYGGSADLNVHQHIYDDSRRRSGTTSERQPHVEGEVVFRRSSAANPEGEISFEVVTNDKDLEARTHMSFDSRTQELDVSTPRSVPWSWSQGPCIQMRITVLTPDGGKLENLKVNATQLDINVDKGVNLAVRGDTFLRTVSGDVTVPTKDEGDEADDPYRISDRRTIVHTVSGDVKGWFALNDLLKVLTVSGTVDLGIDPKQVDHDAPAPAELIISTTSGDVTATEPISHGIRTTTSSLSSYKFPARDYTVDILTVSGDIDTSLAFTSKASIHTQSGDLKVKLRPVLDPSDTQTRSQLDTNSKSGTTNLQVLEPLWVGIVKGPGGKKRGDGEKEEDDKGPWVIIHPHESISSLSSQSSDRPLGNLASRHGSISGDIKVHYPSAWEGGLVAETLSGTQKVRGKGLEMFDMTTPLMKTISGRKGSGSSDMKVVTISGSENLLVGEEPN